MFGGFKKLEKILLLIISSRKVDRLEWPSREHELIDVRLGGVDTKKNTIFSAAKYTVIFF